MLKVVHEFFVSGKMLKSFSFTTMTLIPKYDNPTMVKDDRPIACCTTFYKLIAKILTNRLKKVIRSIIVPSQSSFVEGRSIIDNILFSHELFKRYSIKGLSPRCVLKVDLRKSYDSVEWFFLKGMLAKLGFPTKFISWVMECISSVSYSLILNGGLTKPFQGKIGIRQGDPMSPYFFVIVMEYLNRFKLHRQRKGLPIPP